MEAFIRVFLFCFMKSEDIGYGSSDTKITITEDNISNVCLLATSHLLPWSQLLMLYGKHLFG